MGNQQLTRSHQSIVYLLILLNLALLNLGCGQSFEEKQAKDTAERKELIRKIEEKDNKISDHILVKHNSIWFSPKTFREDVFTYELQKIFSKYSERTVLFKGYLEDVAETDQGIVVEFLCFLGEQPFINKIAIRFRLTASEAIARQLLEGKRKDSMFLSLFHEPDYFVVAKIKDLKSTRTFQSSGSAHGDEVEIDLKVSRSFESTGILIEAVSRLKD